MKIIFLLKFLILSLNCFGYSKEIRITTSEYYVDKESVKQIYNFHELSSKKIASNETKSIGYNEKTAVWIRIKLHNTTSKTIQKFVCVNHVNMDSVEFFYKNNYHLFGDRTNKNGRYFSTISIPINIKPFEKIVLVIRQKKILSALNFSYSLRDKNEVFESFELRLFIIGIYLGVNLLLIIYAISLFLKTKRKIFLLLCFHIVFTIGYCLILTGFIKHYFYPENIYLSEINVLFTNLWFLIILFLVLEILNLKKKKLLILINLICISLMIALFIARFYANVNILRIVSVICTSNFLFITALIIYFCIKSQKNNKTARLVLLAFIPHLIWILLIILKSLTVITFEADYLTPMFCNIFEVVVLGYLLQRQFFSTFQTNILLTKENEQQLNLSIRKVEWAQLNERKQIAHLIHDNFSSKLAYLSNVEGASNFSDGIAEIAEDLRNISHSIFPRALKDGAFLQALYDEIKIQNTRDKNCKIVLRNFGIQSLLKIELASTLYLICLEIIYNSKKHGFSNEIILEFYAHDNEFLFQFTDDGKGLDKDFKKGHGLTTIEERIHDLDGTIEISSIPSTGVVIQISIPKLLV